MTQVLVALDWVHGRPPFGMCRTVLGAVRSFANPDAGGRTGIP
jgi:hypothetical protein